MEKSTKLPCLTHGQEKPKTSLGSQTNKSADADNNQASQEKSKTSSDSQADESADADNNKSSRGKSEPSIAAQNNNAATGQPGTSNVPREILNSQHRDADASVLCGVISEADHFTRQSEVLALARRQPKVKKNYYKDLLELRRRCKQIRIERLIKQPEYQHLSLIHI